MNQQNLLRANTFSIIQNDKFYYSTGIFVVIALNWMLWQLPTKGVFDLVPFFTKIGFQRISMVFTIFIIMHFYKQYNLLSLSYSRYFYFFIFFIILSFSIAVYNSSLEVHTELNKMNNSLAMYSIFKGFFAFVSIVVFLKNQKIFKSFIALSIFIGVFLSLITYLGFADLFISLFGGVSASEDALEFSNGLVLTRFTFPLLDNNTFGGILGGLVILSLFYIYYYSLKKVYLIFPLFLSIICFLGLGRANSLKLILSVLIFYGILLNFKFKIKYVLYLLPITFISLLYFQTDVGSVLITRWQNIIDNLLPFFQGGGSRLMVTDNFTWRILAAIFSFPTTTFGWIFGNGGIQRGYVIGIDSASHIELANWVSQYGLLTFISLLTFIFLNLIYFFKLKIDYKITTNKGIIVIKATGISLIIGFLMEALNSPMFFAFWFWLGLFPIFIYRAKETLEKPNG